MRVEVELFNAERGRELASFIKVNSWEHWESIKGINNRPSLWINKVAPLINKIAFFILKLTVSFIWNQIALIVTI